MARPRVPRVGEASPPLELPLDTGDPFSLAPMPGRPVLVSFLSHAA